MKSWDEFLTGAFDLGITWLILAMLVVIYAAILYLQKKSGKKQSGIKSYKQRVFDRWHDRDT